MVCHGKRIFQFPRRKDTVTASEGEFKTSTCPQRRTEFTADGPHLLMKQTYGIRQCVSQNIQNDQTREIKRFLVTITANQDPLLRKRISW